MVLWEFYLDLWRGSLWMLNMEIVRSVFFRCEKGGVGGKGFFYNFFCIVWFFVFLNLIFEKVYVCIGLIKGRKKNKKEIWFLFLVLCGWGLFSGCCVYVWFIVWGFF